MDTTFATNYLNMAGLTIYSTQDSSIQKEMETEFEKTKYQIIMLHIYLFISLISCIFTTENQGYNVERAATYNRLKTGASEA